MKAYISPKLENILKEEKKPDEFGTALAKAASSSSAGVFVKVGSGKYSVKIVDKKN